MELLEGSTLKVRTMAAALEGEIALAQGDLQRAETAFQSAEPVLKLGPNLGAPLAIMSNNHPIRDGVARVKAARGDLDGAIAYYRKLVTLDISQKWTAVLEPRHVLQLARLLDKKGDKSAARQEYARFLELWKKADADLPELKEARTRVAALR